MSKMTVAEYKAKLIEESFAGHFPCRAHNDAGCRYIIRSDAGNRHCVIGLACPTNVCLRMDGAGSIYDYFHDNGGMFPKRKKAGVKEFLNWRVAKEYVPLSFWSAARLQRYHDVGMKDKPWDHDKFLDFLETIPEFAAVESSSPLASTDRPSDHRPVPSA